MSGTIVRRPRRSRSREIPADLVSVRRITTGWPDAIFFLGHREVELTAQQKADLLSFVKDEGKGFVAAHTAVTAFESWPEFGELLGARYDGHPWNTAYGSIINEDPAFPATKHFPAVFNFTDEFYQAREYSRDKIRVLLRLDVSKMPANPEVHRTDGDSPLAWAKKNHHATHRRGEGETMDVVVVVGVDP